jgi:hypothetical protein
LNNRPNFLLSMFQGKYEMLNYSVAPEEVSEQDDRGEYKLNFRMTLSNGSCVYGEELCFKIVDQ